MIKMRLYYRKTEKAHVFPPDGRTTRTDFYFDGFSNEFRREDGIAKVDSWS